MGQPVKLTPPQREWLKMIYDTPTRLFVLSVGRKNAKTAFSSFLLLLHLIGPEARRNTSLFSAALSRDQASRVFDLTKKTLELSPFLREFVQILPSSKTIKCPELGNVYTALSADAKTNMGGSPCFVIHDELGQVNGSRFDMYETLETATAAHDSPLSIVISTQARNDSDFFSLLLDDALSGADPLKKAVLYSAPLDIDAFTVDAVRAANPHFEYFMNQDEVLRMADEARRMPSKEAYFRNLILNQRVEARAPFVSPLVWKENSGITENDATADKFDPSEAIFAGLDLSSVSDLTAFVMIDSRGAIECRFWLPSLGLSEKAKEDRAPYDLWRDQGFLSTTAGAAIEYDEVAAEILRMIETHSIKKIAFDRWNMRFLKSAFARLGFDERRFDDLFVSFGQGFASMTPALRALESRLLQRKLKHFNNPILEWNARNVLVMEDAAGNRKFDKSDKRGRIDGMVALAMAAFLQDENSTGGNIAELDAFLNDPVMIF